VDVFKLAHWGLLAIAVVTVIWPLNIPLVALAYKARQGNKPIDMESGEFWLRSSFAALGLTVFTGIAIGLDYLLVVWAEMSAIAGGLRLVLLMLYVPTAAAYLFWMFALEDFFQGLAVFFLDTLLPWLALFLVIYLPLLLIGLVVTPVRQLRHRALDGLVSLKEILFP
jgi:hypothetical protein